MGGKHSRPVYAPLDPLFQDVACVALTLSDYTNNILDKAPFHMEYFEIRCPSDNYMQNNTTSSYDGMLRELIARFANLGVGNVYGPVYFLTAYDKPRMVIACRLYFPSMAKTTLKFPLSKSYLGNAHLWMNHILFGMGINVRPYSSCQVRLGRKADAYIEKFSAPPPSQLFSTPLPTKIVGSKPPREKDPSQSFMHGCARLDIKDKKCKQSKKVHRGMRLYNRSKASDEYPIAYYHAYRINLHDSRISQFTNSLSPPTLLRNVLPSFLQLHPGCRYALISPNQKYFYILSGRAFTQFYNAGNEDYVGMCVARKRLRFAKALSIRRFVGGFGTYLAIEDNVLNIYSKKLPNGDEFKVYSVKIAIDGAQGPLTMVLNDFGNLDVYDVNDKLVTDPAFGANKDAGAPPGPPIYMGATNDVNSYNAAEDMKRRILNLKAYLRMRGYIIPYDTPSNSTASGTQSQSSETLASSLPSYSYKVDYRGRFEQLLAYLLKSGRISQDEYNSQMKEMQNMENLLNAYTMPDGQDDLLGTGDFGDLGDLGGVGDGMSDGMSGDMGGMSGAVDADLPDEDAEQAAIDAQKADDDRVSAAQKEEEALGKHESEIVSGTKEATDEYVQPEGAMSLETSNYADISGNDGSNTGYYSGGVGGGVDSSGYGGIGDVGLSLTDPAQKQLSVRVMKLKAFLQKRYPGKEIY